MLRPLKVNDRVSRGPDWRFDEQDGGNHDGVAPGTVVDIQGGKSGLNHIVRWDKAVKARYNYSYSKNVYHLQPLSFLAVKKLPCREPRPSSALPIGKAYEQKAIDKLKECNQALASGSDMRLTDIELESLQVY